MKRISLDRLQRRYAVLQGILGGVVGEMRTSSCKKPASRLRARLGTLFMLFGLCAGPVGVTGAAAASTCQDYSFPVYFRRGSLVLAPGAEAAISAAARQFRRCPIGAVTVVSLSSPLGDDPRMEKRLRVVVQALRARGFRRPAPSIAGAVVAHRRPLVSDQAMVSITMNR